MTDMAFNPRFTIPANTDDYKIEAVKKFDQDTLLLTLMPHTHLRGKAFKYEVTYRNGDKEMHKVGEMSTNVKQVPSGVIDLFTQSIVTKKPPEIDGMEGYNSLNVILTAMDAAAQGKIVKIGK